MLVHSTYIASITASISVDQVQCAEDLLLIFVLQLH
jgi:hypothetical protein